MTLTIDNLTLKRGGVAVLSEITAALEPGQITAIVGPNGAGKSSLLMSLAGLLAPDTGSVELDGVPMGALDPRERAKALGYLPQEADIAWDVTVEALIRLGRMPHRDTRAEPVEDAIKALRLEGLRDRPVSQLSGGEKSRALLARVIAGQPRWILADEPLAALDLAHQQTLLNHFKQAASGNGYSEQRAGIGVVMVVHDLAVAMNHASRVLVLNQGRLAHYGPPQQALACKAIADIWDVTTQWLGEPGRQALCLQDRG